MQQRYLFFIGIDISKKWFDAAFTMEGEKEQMYHERFDNTKQGFQALLKALRAWSKRRKLDGTFLFCMEHTGVYTYPICHFLQSKQLAFVLVSGLEIRYSLGIRRGKNDAQDSRDIARYAHLKRKKLIASTLPLQELMLLKHLLAYRNRLVKYKNGLKVAAGELKSFAPTSEAKLVVQDSQAVTKHLQQKIEQTEHRIRQTIRQEDQLEPLFVLATSVKSVGLIIGATLLVYTNAFTAFSNVRKFACYCGIAPFGETSGTSVNKPARVHALGYRKIKALLSNAAQSAINHDAEIKAYYRRKIAEGKHEGKVVNAIKFKILARVFATVKRGTPFVERNTFMT